MYVQENTWFKGLTKEENAQVLCDVGNSAFTMLSCSLIPIWFKELAISTNPGQISSDQATVYYSIIFSIVTILIAIIGPICGAFADYKDTKKIFCTTTIALVVYVLTGAVSPSLAFLSPVMGRMIGFSVTSK